MSCVILVTALRGLSRYVRGLIGMSDEDILVVSAIILEVLPTYPCKIFELPVRLAIGSRAVF